MISLTTNDGQFKYFSPKLKNILADLNNMQDFAALENYKLEIAKNIIKLFNRLITNRVQKSAQKVN